MWKELCKNTEWELDWRKLKKEECLKMSEFERINMLKDKGVFLGSMLLIH